MACAQSEYLEWVSTYSPHLLKLLPLTCSEEGGSAITAMNIHARMISSPTKVTTKKFYDLFSNFINLLKTFHYDESYLEPWKSNILVDAYVAFLDCSEREVDKVKQDWVAYLDFNIRLVDIWVRPIKILCDWE